MSKKIIYLILFACIYIFPKPISAACPSDLNDNDVTVVNGNICTIPAGNTYILDKVENESATTNTANLQLTGGSLTIANTAILKTGTLTPVGGSVIIQDGGSIVIGGTTGDGFWVTDSDADGYAANFTTYTATAAGRRRLGLMKSKTTVDCLDNNISKWQNLTGYADTDSDGYGTGASSQVCSGSTLASGYAANNTDCNDGSWWVYQTKNIANDWDYDRYSADGPYNSYCVGTAYANPNGATYYYTSAGHTSNSGWIDWTSRFGQDCSDSNSNIRTKNATGGTQTFISGYIVHTFTSSDTFTITCGGATDAEILVVAGGGGGSGGGANATSASGGGAGGLVYQASRSLTQNTGYTATVGLGGIGGAASNYDDSARGTTGQNSVFDTITAFGGGAGSLTGAPGTGGSGAGGQYTSSAGASPTQGNSGGGTGYGNYGGAGSLSAPNYGAGGGGGAGGIGTDGNGSIGGAGGIGLNFFGTTYSTGGQGGWYTTGAPGTSGTANTGDGGGGAKTGSANTGGNGGSGIVIVRYANP